MNKILRTHHLYGKHGITGVGKTKFFAMLKDGSFPPPNVCLRDGPKPIHGWTSDVVAAWVESVRTDRAG